MTQERTEDGGGPTAYSVVRRLLWFGVVIPLVLCSTVCGCDRDESGDANADTGVEQGAERAESARDPESGEGEGKGESEGEAPRGERGAGIAEGVRIVGHGVALRPKRPYEVGREPEKGSPDKLVVAVALGSELQNAMVLPGKTPPPSSTISQITNSGEESATYAAGTEGTRIVLGSGMKTLDAFGEVDVVPSARSWTIETPEYRMALPKGLTVWRGKSMRDWPFELHPESGEGNAMIFPRGPLRGGEIPKPEALVGPEQTVVENRVGDVETPWIELEYEMDGETWRQRHIYASLDGDSVVLLSVQAPEQRASGLTSKAMELAKTIERND